MSDRFLRLDDVPLAGRRVFIRADFNVPLTDDGQVADDSRICATLPGIRRCLDAGAAVVVNSHLGRPKEGALGRADSLAPVADCLARLLAARCRSSPTGSTGVSPSAPASSSCSRTAAATAARRPTRPSSRRASRAGSTSM